MSPGTPHGCQECLNLCVITKRWPRRDVSCKDGNSQPEPLANPGHPKWPSDPPGACEPCRIFTCVGFTAGSVVCVQIARLWRARGLAFLRIVPCEHFPQEDPGGTTGRPASSPPVPATHAAGADHPAWRNPQAEHRCSGCGLPTARLLPAPGSTSAISRSSPGGHLGTGLPGVAQRGGLASIRRRASGRPIKQEPGHPAARPPRRRRSPAQARLQGHSSASRRLARQNYNQ